jgi:hypothetical protein
MTTEELDSIIVQMRFMGYPADYCEYVRKQPDIRCGEYDHWVRDRLDESRFTNRLITIAAETAAWREDWARIKRGEEV